MKKIGEGWQYSTYDLGNGRVLKKFHSLLRIYWVMLKDIFPFQEDSLFEIPGFARASKRKALASFEILKKNNIPPAWIGNPKLFDNLNYEQDKVRPLHEVFAESDTATIKSIIDQFVIFNKELLAKGAIDKSFNITKNYGINERGELILIDIGELFGGLESIKNQLMRRAWDKHYVSGCIKDKEAQEYFIKKMDENFGVNP